MNKNYLLEIGVEELPARFISDVISQMRNNAVELLKSNRISYSNIDVYSTPRRLTLFIYGLEETQSTAEENVKGPSKKISYNENGEPSKALLGFMKGQGVDINSI